MDTPADVSAIQINTDRLVLRPLALDDLADFYAYASVPGVGEMAGWKHHQSMEESAAILQSMVKRREVLAIVHKADGKMIGTIGLHPHRKRMWSTFPASACAKWGMCSPKPTGVRA